MRPEIRQDGVVLVMVLIMLVALMLIGIGAMRGTVIESRIAGNELRYQRDFYTAEGASDYIVAEFDELMYDHDLDVGDEQSLSAQLPAGTAISGASANIRLMRTGSPPLGSGTSAAYTATNYYRLVAARNVQSVEVGLWRSYPTPQ